MTPSANKVETSQTSVINIKSDEVTSAINELHVIEGSTNERDQSPSLSQGLFSVNNEHITTKDQLNLLPEVKIMREFPTNATNESPKVDHVPQTADTNDEQALMKLIIQSQDVNSIHKSMSEDEDTVLRDRKSSKTQSYSKQRKKYNRTTSETNVKVISAKHRRQRKSPAALNQTQT